MNVVPILLAAATAIFAAYLIYEHTFRSCTATRCEIIDVRHLMMLMLIAIVAMAYIYLGLYWYSENLDSRLSDIDALCWDVLESMYFGTAIYVMHLFRERYRCPRTKGGREAHGPEQGVKPNHKERIER